MKRKKAKLKVNWLIVLLAMLLAVGTGTSSCKSNITLSMTDANPPTFRFHRGLFSEVNSFPLFIVREIDPENQGVDYLQQKYEKNKTVWKIVPDPKLPTASDVDKLPPITYGIIPSGFIQDTPSSGAAPKLEPGKIYEASGAYVLMPDAVIRFKIAGDKLIQVPIPGQ
jgi:hypothetical protein